MIGVCVCVLCALQGGTCGKVASTWQAYCRISLTPAILKLFLVSGSILFLKCIECLRKLLFKWVYTSIFTVQEIQPREFKKIFISLGHLGGSVD